MSVVDPNDVDALIENLVDAFNKAVVKGVRVRADESELVLTYGGMERIRVRAIGEAPPLSSLLRRPHESQAEAEKRVLGDDSGT